MAPAKALGGDLVCALFGCSVPMILRRSKAKDEFTVIGESYVDECMTGEAVNHCDVQEEVFHVV